MCDDIEEKTPLERGFTQEDIYLSVVLLMDYDTLLHAYGSIINGTAAGRWSKIKILKFFCVS